MANFVPRLSVIAGKIEGTAGVEETLANTDAGFVIADPEAEDDIQLIERNFLTAGFGKFAPLIGAKDRRIRFKSELKGSGAAGTVPKIDPFLRACGMTQTPDPGVSNTYAFNTGSETMTVARYLVPNTGTAVKKPIKGAMGAWQLEGSIGGAMEISIDMLGQYLDVIDENPPSSITWDTLKPPQLLQVTFTIGGFSPRISTIRINGGHVVTLPGDMTKAHGKDFAIMTDRVLQVEFDALMENVSTHDWYGRLKDGTEGALTLTVGSVAGNKYTISMPKLQYVQLPEGERDDAAVVNVTARANRNTGDNDEGSIVFD